ncbi:MAG: sigma-70 family RNA polymerase sigma factor [Phycisphaeraceae bacterium]|nr:sigma-70 family RNA polymerase sigma factor [Phycisphaeraceae bacterium]
MDERQQKVLQLLDEHGPSLYGHVARLTRCEHVTRDLMQDLFVKLQTVDGFDQIQDLYAYAWRMATNLAFDWHRRQRIVARSKDSVVSREIDGSHPLDQVIQSEQIQQLLGATAQLNDLARQVIVMRFMEQASYDEIALRLNKKSGYLRSLCSKSLARLRDLLSEQDAGQQDRRCGHG